MKNIYFIDYILKNIDILPDLLKNQKVFKDGMTVLWKMAADGIGNDKKSIQTLYLGNLNLILELTEKVKKEQLHFNI